MIGRKKMNKNEQMNNSIPYKNVIFSHLFIFTLVCHIVDDGCGLIRHLTHDDITERIRYELQFPLLKYLARLT